jgi:hypothetical protein
MSGLEVKIMQEANLKKYEDELIARSRMERYLEVAQPSQLASTSQ